MDLKAFIKQSFDQAVLSAPVDQELKNAAKVHPNTQVMLNNLYKELLKVEAHRKTQNKKSLQPLTIKGLVVDFVHKLLLGIENEANRRVESDLAKIAREKEIQKQKDLEASSQGNFVGEYKELQEGLNIKEIHAESPSGDTL